MSQTEQDKIGDGQRTDEDNFRHRVILTVSLVTVIGLVALLFISTISIVPLVFIAILNAVLIRTLSEPLTEFSNISARWSVLIVVIGLVAGLGAFAIVTGPGIVDQLGKLNQRIPAAINNVEQTLLSSDFGSSLLDSLDRVPNSRYSSFSGEPDIPDNYHTVTIDKHNTRNTSHA